MKVQLEATVRELLVEEFGEEVLKLESELDQLAKLVIKRKEAIQSCNRSSNKRNLENYKQVDAEIKELISGIQQKLPRKCVAVKCVTTKKGMVN